jgi:hypothetical protein
VRILSMISACDLHSPAIALPSEGFCGCDQSATDTLPLMIERDRQGSQTRKIPGRVK